MQDYYVKGVRLQLECAMMITFYYNSGIEYTKDRQDNQQESGI